MYGEQIKSIRAQTGHALLTFIRVAIQLENSLLNECKQVYPYIDIYLLRMYVYICVCI